MAMRMECSVTLRMPGGQSPWFNGCEPFRTEVQLQSGRGDMGVEDDAVVVAQETMVRAWRQAARLDLSGPSLMPWLTTVARRIVIDEHRRKQVRPAESGEGVVADMPVDDDTSATILRVAVAEAMRELSPAHRQILNETILRDRSVNQAAEALGIPVGTVKSRVYYATRALQVILAERGLLP